MPAYPKIGHSIGIWLEVGPLHRHSICTTASSNTSPCDAQLTSQKNPELFSNVSLIIRHNNQNFTPWRPKDWTTVSWPCDLLITVACDSCYMSHCIYAMNVDEKLEYSWNQNHKMWPQPILWAQTCTHLKLHDRFKVPNGAWFSPIGSCQKLKPNSLW